LEALFDNGSIVLIILIFVVIEAAVLLLFRRRTGRGIPHVPMLANLLAGGCLMLAIRSALLDHPWIWIGLYMSLALIAHLIDFGSRIVRDGR
jgi:hypothetical protein